MGWRENTQANAATQSSMSIELFAPHQDPSKTVFAPGTTIKGHVVLRPTKPLIISQIRLKIIGDSFGIIQAGPIRPKMYHYAQSVLFESKQTLASGDPLTLDPINNDTNPAGYRFPFEVILPEQTAWHEVNSKNWQNKWKPRYPFLGFEEMHPLPPTLRTKGSRMLKEHECHLNYHIAAKCKKAKVKGATSTLWLPFTGVELYVWPTRNERSPEMKMLTLRSDPRKLKAGGAMTVAIKVPGVIAGGNRVTINVGVEGTTGGKEVVLSELVVKLKGEVWVRARNLLTGERHSMEKFKNVVGEWKGLNQRISGEVALQSELNKRTIPTFMSYVFALPEYTYAVGYTVIVGGEMVKGKIRGGPVKVMSSVLKR